MATESNQVSDTITVTVKQLNGDILHLETDPLHGCKGIKQLIHNIHSDMLVPLQQLIRIDDEKVDPEEIRDQDVFLLIVRMPTITFFEDDHVDINGHFMSHNSPFELHTIFFDGAHFFEFIYHKIKHLYLDVKNANYTDHNGYDQYYIPKNREWFVSLKECIAASKKMSMTSPLLEEVETRFHQA